MEKYLYIYHTKDKYELPLAVADNLKQLADLTGINQGNIASALSKQKKGIYNSRFKKVRILDDNTKESEEH